jgi:hypothetical protein
VRNNAPTEHKEQHHRLVPSTREQIKDFQTQTRINEVLKILEKKIARMAKQNKQRSWTAQNI